MSSSTLNRDKVLSTLGWSGICVAAAMAADYLITIVLLGDYASYTPVITFVIASVVALPVTYAMVSSRYNLRQARDELARARDAAINANLSKTMFFANMSHELRTPLNAIIGFSDLLATDIFAAKRVEYAHLIHNSGTHLLDLVNDLLEISRMEAGKLQLREESVDVVSLVEECTTTLEPRARAGKLQLTRRLARDLPRIRADQRATKQILLNLLTNAIKFSGPGGTIETFAYIGSSGEPAIGVRDEGIGISEEDQRRVFEPFKQGKHDVLAVQESTGLGLPIVKGLAEAHGGRVTLESRTGEGTCVTVRLPAHRAEPTQTIALAS